VKKTRQTKTLESFIVSMKRWKTPANNRWGHFRAKTRWRRCGFNWFARRLRVKSKP